MNTSALLPQTPKVDTKVVDDALTGTIHPRITLLARNYAGLKGQTPTEFKHYQALRPLLVEALVDSNIPLKLFLKSAYIYRAGEAIQYTGVDGLVILRLLAARLNVGIFQTHSLKYLVADTNMLLTWNEKLESLAAKLRKGELAGDLKTTLVKELEFHLPESVPAREFDAALKENPAAALGLLVASQTVALETSKILGLSDAAQRGHPPVLLIPMMLFCLRGGRQSYTLRSPSGEIIKEGESTFLCDFTTTKLIQEMTESDWSTGTKVSRKVRRYTPKAKYLPAAIETKVSYKCLVDAYSHEPKFVECLANFSEEAESETDAEVEEMRQETAKETLVQNRTAALATSQPAAPKPTKPAPATPPPPKTKPSPSPAPAPVKTEAKAESAEKVAEKVANTAIEDILGM